MQDEPETTTPSDEPAPETPAEPAPEAPAEETPAAPEAPAEPETPEGGTDAGA